MFFVEYYLLTMKYRDYKIVAKKHLDACLSIMTQYDNDEIPENVLREIHYLSGYIIEGVCVYAIYKHYEWDDNKDIKEYDPDFTRETGLDYYKDGLRRNISNQVIFTGAQYFVTSHGFNRYVELLDVPFQGTNIPYIDASAEIDDVVCDMIDNWQPDLRYRYGSLNKHTKEEVRMLVSTCERIYNQVIRTI